MYKNQYVISSQAVPCPPEFASRKFGDLAVYAHPSLNVSMARNRSAHILLLGYILDPSASNATDKDIVERLVEECDTTESLIREVQRFSGRFVLLLRNESDCVALHDACGLRQINYSFDRDGVVLTSSLRMYLDLFNVDLEIAESTREFIELDDYEKTECGWYGDECLDDRFRKLLPNYVLDIDKRKPRRVPIFRDALSDGDPVEYVANTLQSTFKALTQRYRLIQPLTAGWDTRILLAAARKYQHEISFYVFQDQDAPNVDTQISQSLAEGLGLDLHVIQPEELSESFLEHYRREHVIPRILPKTRNIQYHYFANADRGVLNVNGNCAEIARCFFGRSGRDITPEMLRVFSGYDPKNQYVNRAIGSWFAEAREFCLKYDIPVLDLFYWEQRMGHWGSQYPKEQDIAIEEFSPFNNRNLLLSILRVPSRERAAPNYAFFRRLIEKLWPEVLTEPINPGGPVAYLKKVMKRNSATRYYSYILKKKLSR